MRPYTNVDEMTLTAIRDVLISNKVKYKQQLIDKAVSLLKGDGWLDWVTWRVRDFLESGFITIHDECFVWNDWPKRVD